MLLSFCISFFFASCLSSGSFFYSVQIFINFDGNYCLSSAVEIEPKPLLQCNTFSDFQCNVKYIYIYTLIQIRSFILQCSVFQLLLFLLHLELTSVKVNKTLLSLLLGILCCGKYLNAALCSRRVHTALYLPRSSRFTNERHRQCYFYYALSSSIAESLLNLHMRHIPSYVPELIFAKCLFLHCYPRTYWGVGHGPWGHFLDSYLSEGSLI